MEKLYLEDLKGYTDDEIIKHLEFEYDADSTLLNYEIIIAYESVGDWGCDSSSFFLMRNKLDGKFYEVHGSHCSCYGFEGQFEPQESSYDYLMSDNFSFYCGGYDDNETLNQSMVKEFLRTKLIGWVVQ